MSMSVGNATAKGTALILKEAAFAAAKHRDQRRKDAEASRYINHPLALAHVLASEGDVTDPIVLAAALLHDTLEDTVTSVEELTGAFGARVAGHGGGIYGHEVVAEGHSQTLASLARGALVQGREAHQTGGQDLQSPGRARESFRRLVARAQAGVLRLGEIGD